MFPRRLVGSGTLRGGTAPFAHSLFFGESHPSCGLAIGGFGRCFAGIGLPCCDRIRGGWHASHLGQKRRWHISSPRNFQQAPTTRAHQTRAVVITRHPEYKPAIRANIPAPSPRAVVHFGHARSCLNPLDSASTDAQVWLFQPCVELQNPLHLRKSLGMLVGTVARGDDFLGRCAIQMSAPVGHHPIA